MEWGTVVAAAVTAMSALIGTYFSNKKQTAVVDYRIKELEKKVDKHNNVIERVYKLEQKVEDQGKKAS